MNTPRMHEVDPVDPNGNAKCQACGRTLRSELDFMTACPGRQQQRMIRVPQLVIDVDDNNQ